MKANYFDLKFWRNYLLAFLASTLLAFLFSFQIAAQPGDCISMNWKGCEKQRDELLQKYAAEIKALDEKILSEPKNAELYYRRGKIYSDMMFEKRLGFKTVEFDGRVYFSEIDAKAIADYTQAISLAPTPAYFEERGNVYRAYWEKETSALDIGEKRAKAETLKIIEWLFLENENFNAAESDFQKAAESSADSEMPGRSRWKLINLHLVRAHSLGGYEDIAAIISNEKAADVALADQDYVIDFYTALYTRNKNFGVKTSLYDALISKGRIARNFGRDALALKVFNEAEKYWDKTELDCFVYTYRAEIFLKRPDTKSALREFTSALDSENPNCRPIASFRGDIYFRQGDWRAAIQDYTAFLNTEHGTTSEKTYIKRGKAYLNLGEGEKAVADFEYVIDKLFHTSCPQYFQMRAEGYKLIGKTELAAADEKAASELPGNLKQARCQTDL